MNKPFRISESDILFGRGKVHFLNRKKRTMSSAYQISDRAAVRIEIPKALTATKITLEIRDSLNESVVLVSDFIWESTERENDVYRTRLPINKLGVGVFFLSIRLVTILGEVFGIKVGRELFFSKNSFRSSFQLTVSDFKYIAPYEQYGGVIYHIFVDRFNYSGERKIRAGGYLVNDWKAPIPEYPRFPGEPIKNNYFYGGNLWGISDKLDYIKSLGATAIYLSPIFNSPSNHKYDTADYMHVDEAFGGDAALKNLIVKARKLGISIILDGVFNHTGDDSIYFNKYGTYADVGAFQSKESAYFPWYTFTSYPDEYLSWWGIKILPKINTALPECRDYFVGKNGVIEKYAKMGVYGFRLDVADELSDSFIGDIKKKLDDVNGNSILYGEVWEDASNKIAYGTRKTYYLGSELDGVMNYPLRIGLIDFLKDGKEEKLRYALNEVTFNAPKRIRDAQMNILGTHDTERIITVLGAKEPRSMDNEYLSTLQMSDEEYQRGKRRLLLAATAIYTLPGIPCVYYGDEAGLQGYSDPFNRRTFPWGNIDSEILIHYQTLAKVRQSSEAYKNGDFHLLHLEKRILMFERTDRTNSYLTIINNSEEEICVNFSHKAESLLDMKKSDLFRIQPEKSLIIKAKRNTQFEI